jgi:hypothetical protein
MMCGDVCVLCGVMWGFAWLLCGVGFVFVMFCCCEREFGPCGLLYCDCCLITWCDE